MASVPSSSVPARTWSAAPSCPSCTCSGSGRAVDDVAADAGAVAVDDAGTNGHGHAGRGERDDRERAHLAVGRDVDAVVKSVPQQLAQALRRSKNRARSWCTRGPRGAGRRRRARGSRRSGSASVSSSCRSSCCGVSGGRGETYGRRRERGTTIRRRPGELIRSSGCAPATSSRRRSRASRSPA